MELKYYLRGLGLGIVVTAIIMGITSSRSRAMTDEEIIARAKQLGMTESRVLTEAASEDDDMSENGPGNDGTENPEKNTDQEIPEPSENGPEQNAPENAPEALSPSVKTEAASSDGTAAAVPDDGETGQDTRTDPDAQTEQEGAAQDVVENQNASERTDETGQDSEGAPGMSVVITVGSGDGSYAVSRKLEDAGAVSSASAFDTFLCENGYDKRIRAGNYTIPPDASDEQIARMITGQGTE